MTTATKVKAAQVVTPTRAERIERYVLLDALDLVVQNLRITAGDPYRQGMLYDLLPDGELLADGASLSAALFEELWPVPGNENPDENPEFTTASARSCLLTSRIFAALAANGEECQRISDYFAGLVDRDLRRLDEQEAKANA